MKLAIRCDASLQIGSGHLMRCLTLADAWRRQGGEVLFICRELPGHLGDVVRAKGFRLDLLPPPAKGPVAAPAGPAHAAWLGVGWQEDAQATRQALQGWGRADWLAVDHYALDAAWERELRRETGRILVIDDLADRDHDCDLLLDQNLFPDMETRYRGRIPAHCRCLLGPRHALLRPEFAAAAAARSEPGEEVRRILVFFGGSDLGNETGKAIEAFHRLNRPDLALDAAIGAGNPHRQALADLCRTLPNVRLHCQVDNMAELMAGSDLAIGAAGSATWERCALGLSTIAWPLADNQKAVLAAVSRQGSVYAPDPASVADAEGLAAHLFAVLHNRDLRLRLARASRELCDGRGVQRVLAALTGSAVTLRPAGEADCASLHAWRNHPEIRAVSGQSDPIDWEIHRQWFHRTLANPDRLLLIGEAAGKPVAVVRFDIDGEQAEVSIYAVPGHRGAGAGASTLAAGERYLAEKRPQVRRVLARILADNGPSVAMFRAGGYRLATQFYEKELPT